ncbi:MAG: DUF2878 domain-containing protein [Gammaproteobacteria bacterium]|nr:DUF2878 domain-containing protein [Gammaproteobacteria bacterium]
MLLMINFAAFQIGWVSSVIGGAQQMPWLGPLAAVVALTIHFRAARRPIEEILLVLSCALIGAAFDSVLVASGWVSYSSGQISSVLAPYWIVTMWMLFATTLNVSMRWLRGKPAIAAAFGLIGGPLAYIAGQKLGGIELSNPIAALIALGIGWAVMMPILLRLSEIFDGMSAEPALSKRWIPEKQEW